MKVFSNPAIQVPGLRGGHRCRTGHPGRLLSSNQLGAGGAGAGGSSTSGNGGTDPTGGTPGTGTGTGQVTALAVRETMVGGVVVNAGHTVGSLGSAVRVGLGQPGTGRAAH